MIDREHVQKVSNMEVEIVIKYLSGHSHTAFVLVFKFNLNQADNRLVCLQSGSWLRIQLLVESLRVLQVTLYVIYCVNKV